MHTLTLTHICAELRYQSVWLRGVYFWAYAYIVELTTPFYVASTSATDNTRAGMPVSQAVSQLWVCVCRHVCAQLETVTAVVNGFLCNAVGSGLWKVIQPVVVVHIAWLLHKHSHLHIHTNIAFMPVMSLVSIFIDCSFHVEAFFKCCNHLILFEKNISKIYSRNNQAIKNANILWKSNFSHSVSEWVQRFLIFYSSYRLSICIFT